MGILSRSTKNIPVIIGEPGVGKTVVVEGLARRIVRGDVPSNLADVRLFALDMGALVAGTQYKGQFEERLKAVLKEVENAEGKVIIFIDEIHLVLGASRCQGLMDAANLFKPMLARGQLRCIGETSLDEYRKYVEKDAAFESRFQQVHVSEPSDTIIILHGLKKKFEGHHGVRIKDRAIVVAAQMSSRYITGIYMFSLDVNYSICFFLLVAFIDYFFPIYLSLSKCNAILATVLSIYKYLLQRATRP